MELHTTVQLQCANGCGANNVCLESNIIEDLFLLEIALFTVHAHLTNPKLILGKSMLRYSGAFLFNNVPTSIKEAKPPSTFKNLL